MAIYGQNRFVIILCYSLLALLLAQCTAKRRLPPPLPQTGRPEVKIREQLIAQDFQRAEQLYQEGQYAKALELFQLFLLTYPSTPFTAQTHFRIGEILYRQKQYAQSLEVLRKFQETFPHSPLHEEATYLLALNYYQTGQYEASRSLLQQLFLSTTDPNKQAEIRYRLALNYVKEGKPFLALEQASQLLVTDREEHQQKGEDLFVQIVEDRLPPSDWEQVKQRYAPAPFFDRILLRLAEHAYQKRQYQVAHKYLQEFLSLFPQQAQTAKVQALLQQLAEVQATLVNKAKIGVLLPFSGEGSFAGESAWQGVQLALSTAGSVPGSGELQLVTRDTAGDPERVAELIEELVAKEQVIAVIGPLFSRVAKKAAPVADTFRVPLLTPFAPDGDFPSSSPYVFRNSLTNTLQAQAIAQYSIQHLGLSRFAILFPEDSYGRDLQQLFHQFVTQLGGNITAEVSYSPDTTNFTPQVRQLGGISDEGLQQQGISEIHYPYDAIFIPDYYNKVGLITTSLGFYNIKNVQLVGANGWNDPRLIKVGNQFVEGAIFVDGFFLDSPYPRVQEFVRNFQSTFNRDPNILAAQAYDTATLLLTILQQGAETRDAVQEALAATRNFSGVSGELTFLPSGDAEKTLFILSVKDGRIVQIN